MSIEENRKRIDDALSFLTIKKLVTPVSKTEAYKLGLVDNVGKIVKLPETPEEEDALTLFDKFVFKLKRLLGGKISQLNNFMYLQTLDNNFYNNIIVKGAIEQRAGIQRIKKDLKTVIEKHDITLEELLCIVIHEDIREATDSNGYQKEEMSTVSVGIDAGGEGSHKKKVFGLVRREYTDEEKKRKKDLDKKKKLK